MNDNENIYSAKKKFVDNADSLKTKNEFINENDNSISMILNESKMSFFIDHHMIDLYVNEYSKI